jgi:thiosulfate dehydrogenase (quinone) large subunit
MLPVKGKSLMKLQTREARKLRPDSMTTTRATYMTFRQKGIGVVRILFGVAWAVAAILKWQPAFIQSFAATVEGASQGQPAIIQAWIGLWVNMVHMKPTLFGFLAALIESLLAFCFTFGVLTNIASIIGIVWSFIVWSVPEGFGGPYVAGQSTDIGTTFPYMLLCALLLLLSSGRYLGIDRVLTPQLGRFGFLAAGPLGKQEVDE